MKFDLITENERLWAVRYNDCFDNVLDSILGQWNDVTWLRSFFKQNIDDLSSYFKITDVNQAIYDTIEDSERLQCLIMDISPDANLDNIFRPLENSRTSEMLLGKEKARLHNTPRHVSWLRIYAIKLEPGIYIITGGAIKLTRTMQEREHTLVELARMEKVRRFLLDNDIADKDSFMEFLNEIISNLKKHQSSTPSKWRENAEWRIANKSWLRYSQHIAMMMLDKMEELKMNQKQLSELMGCSQQYVSKVLKGQENLSLETLSKIERCLKIQILSLNHSA